MKQKNATVKSKVTVKDLLSKMSLEEKVGQMTQVNLHLMLEGTGFNLDGKVDENLLEQAVVQFKVGSVLNAINRPYSLEVWHQILTKIQDASQRTPNQIPVLYGIDSIHGASFAENATLFPHNLGLAASRNDELAEKIAHITAKETRASGIRWNFDPVLDIGRNPVWSRFPETYGEDVLLTERMGAAMVKGYQQNRDYSRLDAVAACGKHYVGYSNPASGKDRTPAYIPEIQLREYYLPQFKKAIDLGVETIMINSGEVNGIPVHANSYLLKDVLRGELGFEGVTVSDWEDIIRLHKRHHVAATPMEAVKMAVMAGVDMSMVPQDFSFATYLIELVEEGEVPMERIDEAAGRILALKIKLGLFENPYPEKEALEQFGKPEYEEVALQAARESITLLKNSASGQNGKGPVLPLGKNKRYLVTGPAAHSLSTLHGSWSFTWQGDNEYWYPEGTKTIYKAIREKVGKKQVSTSYRDGFGKEEYYYFEPWAREVGHHCPTEARLEVEIAKIKERAKQVDYIILCLGEEAYAESPGVVDDLYMPKYQCRLAHAAADTGKPVILVLTLGRPLIIRSIAKRMHSILLAYQPGSKGADAIADVLFGDYNPSGKLPFSYPAFPNDMLTYDHKYSERIQELWPGFFTYGGYKPQWPFGYGLSYTEVEYSKLKLAKDEITGDEPLKISIDITNTGQVAGWHIVDVFTRDLYASVTPSQRRLRDYSRVYLEPNQTKNLQFTLTRNDLAFVNQQMKWVTEAGQFEIYIGTECTLFSWKEK